MRDLIIAGVIAASSFGAAWTVQNWRYGDQINQIKAEVAEASEKALKKAADQTAEMQRKKDEAINEANKRAQENALAAAASRSAADSLRQQLTKARASLPQATCEAARNYAEAVSDVFGSCVQEYRNLAEKADSCYSDLKLMQDSWPSQ